VRSGKRQEVRSGKKQETGNKEHIADEA